VTDNASARRNGPPARAAIGRNSILFIAMCAVGSGGICFNYNKLEIAALHGGGRGKLPPVASVARVLNDACNVKTRPAGKPGIIE
jgi:hypothetical protein